MAILVFLSHPAQFLFYKNAISELRRNGYQFFLLIKTKDILSELLDDEGFEYNNILPNVRGRSKFRIFWSLIIRDFRIWKFAREHEIHLLMGSDASLAHVGRLIGKPCITTLEDDYAVIKNLARLTYPFTTDILVPEVCDVGPWRKKKSGYEGYMKLAYLHPVRFTPDRSKVKLTGRSPYFLIRLSGLSAHHDFGIKGISYSLLDNIIKYLSKSGNIYISSENELPPEYEIYRLKIPAKDIHHYLFYSEMLICDSQSMAVEAAVLGVPNIRISGFAGKIRILEELEHKYKLTFGISPENSVGFFSKLDELFNVQDLRNLFQSRRMEMLSEKIDVTAFLIWFIKNYPESPGEMKKNPDFQNRFRSGPGI
jgi:uncharacterized protein